LGSTNTTNGEWLFVLVGLFLLLFLMKKGEEGPVKIRHQPVFVVKLIKHPK